jgi:4-hydroxybenzoate polyprenyltransferase
MTRPSALLRLLRLPAVLTVPGDALLGAAWGGEGAQPAAAATRALGSSLLYLGGMALNDWVDRERDARERPHRPIPAGEVAPATALGSAIALTCGGIAAAGAAGGARGLRAAAALAGVVWLYDLQAKDTPAGPPTMALARALDVLMGVDRRSMGADRRSLRAGAPAAIVGAHALLVTLVSAHEVEGAEKALIGRVLAAVAAVATSVVVLVLSAPRRARVRVSARETVPALASLALYACVMGRASLRALRHTDPAHLQQLVATGVLANMPLQAALLAGRGRRAAAAALLVGWPAARWAGRRASVT